MNAILGLIVIGLFAYLGAALMRQRRFSLVSQTVISSGVGFFGVGFVLGPHGTDLLTTTILANLDTFIDLGLGWVGFLFGIQLRFGDLRKMPWRHYLAAFVQAAAAYGVVALALAGLLLLVSPEGVGPRFFMVTVFGLAAIAAVTSPTTAALASQRLGVRGPVGTALQLMASFDALPAILALAVPVCFAEPLLVDGFAGGLLTLGIAIGVGLLIGALFHLLTLYRYNDDQLLVVIVGAVVFAGGAACSLGLSPLFVSVVAGAAVANLVRERHRTLRVFLAIEKPTYLLMAALAGALWTPASWVSLLIAALFVFARLAGKLLGGALAGPVAGLRVGGRFGFGPGLVGHGGMAVALAVSLQQRYPDTIGNVVLTATIASVLLTSVLAPCVARSFLANHEEGA